MSLNWLNLSFVLSFLSRLVLYFVLAVCLQAYLVLLCMRCECLRAPLPGAWALGSVGTVGGTCLACGSLVRFPASWGRCLPELGCNSYCLRGSKPRLTLRAEHRRVQGMSMKMFVGAAKFLRSFTPPSCRIAHSYVLLGA